MSKSISATKARVQKEHISETLKALVSDSEVRAVLAAECHPSQYQSRMGRTLADYADFICSRGGNASKKRLLAAIRKRTGK